MSGVKNQKQIEYLFKVEDK